MKIQVSKRFLSLLLTLAMCLSLVNLAPAQAASDFSDISGHWGEATIEKWAGHGLVNGKPGGLFAPGDDITRGELAAVLSRLMRYQTVAENTYGDVQDGAWYAEAILQATRAGVIQGDGANARPEAKITREEVMVIMARIMNLTGGADAPEFSDAGQVSSWAADAVGAMAAKGYVQGNNGMIRPKDNITRVEVLTILDNVFAKLYDEAGTYTEDMTGNVVVNTSDVELKDMSISGDLLVAQGVAEGDFVLDNVALAGNLIVRGGGVNSIYIINGSTVGGTVSIERNDGRVRVVTDGSVEVVSIDDGSDDVILEGDFADVTLAAADVTLTVEGSIDTLTVADTAIGATVDVPKGSEVGKVETAADDVTIRGEGKVTEVDVVDGDGVSVQTPGTKVVVSEDAGPVDAGGKTIEPGKEGTTPSGVTTGGNTTVSPAKSSNTDIHLLNNAIHVAEVDNEAGEVYMIPRYNVEHLLAEIDATDHSLQNYAVTDSAGAAKGLTDPIAEGDKLTVTAEDGTAKTLTVRISSLKTNLQAYTAGQTQDIILEYSLNRTTAERHYLYGTLTFELPEGITASPTDTFDLIGRGFVELDDASIAAAKDYNHSGRNWVDDIALNTDLRTKVEITNGGRTVIIKDTDFAAYNGVDVTLVLKDQTIPAQGGVFSASFSGEVHSGTAREAVYTESATASFRVTSAVTDLVRKAEAVSYDTPTTVVLEAASTEEAAVYASLDKGRSWVNTGVRLDAHRATLTDLLPNAQYFFKLVTDDGISSNMVGYYTGLYRVTDFGAVADAVVIPSDNGQVKYDGTDNAPAINAAIVAASRNGGGTVYFDAGANFASNSIHLRSNVHLYFDTGSQLTALRNIDLPEETPNYPFSLGQDSGHSYFQDALMWGIRVENIKILGNSAKIYGNQNLATGHGGSFPTTPAVPSSPGMGTKTISLKLAKDIVIGGTDEDNILTFEQGGWFSILSTGCDNITVQNMLLPNSTSGLQRDTFNFMQNNDATAYNVTTLKSSNDVAKLGSDFSLGFIRHVSNITIEKIVAGDIGGGNVFQLGSETIGDVENIVASDLTLTTNANKTGVAIWVNDGSNVSNVSFTNLNLENTSGGIAFGVSPRFETAAHDTDGILQTLRLPSGIRRPGSISNVMVDGAVLSKNAGGDGGFPIVIQGYKRFPNSNSTAAVVDTGSVGTIVNGAVYPVTDITIKNLTLVASYNTGKPATMPTLANTETVIAEAKNGGNYRTSSYTNAGTFPAYGILMKYVDNVTIEDSTIEYEDTLRNDRFAIVIDNGTNVTLENLEILQGGLIGSAIQVRGVSSYNFRNISVKYFNKDYKTQAATAHSDASGATDFDSSVQANLAQSYLFPVVPAPAQAGVDIAFTSTHINAIVDDEIDVAAGTTVQNVLDELISLYGKQTITVVDSAGVAVASSETIMATYKLKVVSVDETETLLLSFTIDTP